MVRIDQMRRQGGSSLRLCKQGCLQGDRRRSLEFAVHDFHRSWYGLAWGNSRCTAPQSDPLPIVPQRVKTKTDRIQASPNKDGGRRQTSFEHSKYSSAAFDSRAGRAPWPTSLREQQYINGTVNHARCLRPTVLALAKGQ